MNIISELKDRFREAVAQHVDDPSAMLDLIRPSQNPQFGDYQANFAMPLAKQLGKPPREVAAQIAEATELTDLCESVEIAGPGFINLKLRDQWLAAELNALRGDARCGVTATPQPRKFVVDFSSPNVAKSMHVGHIRSTVIGDSLCRMLRFVGHDVISDNHLGDWGTQFGMIIYGYKHFVDEASYQADPIVELSRLYRHVRKLMDLWDDHDAGSRLATRLTAQEAKVEQARRALEAGDAKAQKKLAKALKSAEAQLTSLQRDLTNAEQRWEAAQADEPLAQQLAAHQQIRTAVLEETARLHEGDPENRGLWEQFLPACKDSVQRIYDRLSISFDHELGESFYQDQLAAVVTSLTAAGLATQSEGATCVFLDGFETPMIIRKQDGAFLYATSDLATIEYRVKTWNPDAVLYVVDFRQGEHFDKLFAAARKWGYTDLELVHVSFGTVLGDDGRPFRTRAGDTVGLEGLLDEAESRALAVVCELDDRREEEARLSTTERQEVARVVGIAALKYADLSQNRTSDYVFSYDKMLALTGNTATYMQYSYARAHGIFERGGVDVAQLRESPASISIGEPAERDLGLLLLRFPEAIDEALVDYRPNQLTTYLYELAKGFSVFFEQCPVLKAESDSIRDSRLLLSDLTARVLKCGLGLLGIDVVERM
ncbi:MAG: arginine--tRNA ligase [Planctomycetota bacterium]